MMFRIFRQAVTAAVAFETAMLQFGALNSESPSIEVVRQLSAQTGLTFAQVADKLYWEKVYEGGVQR